MAKEEILRLLNHGLELEHAAYVQYLSHAEIVDGINAEPVIARLKEIANDEKNHQDKFRSLIGILGGVPSIKMAPTHPAEGIRGVLEQNLKDETERTKLNDEDYLIKGILEQNLKDEKDAVDTYRKILEALKKEKWQGYYDQILKHEIRHILMDEQEHISELELLLGIQGSSY